jgi:predicted small lipoprotein YifL
MATAAQLFSGLPGKLFGVAVLTLGIAGCGLKGDLYIEAPRTEQSEATTADGSDGQDSGKVPEGIAPEVNDELVNSEAAMDADPAGSVMDPGAFGGETTEQLDSEAAMGTSQSMGITQPVTTIELEGAENDSEDKAEKSSELTDSLAAPETESDSAGSQSPAKEATDAVTSAP